MNASSSPATVALSSWRRRSTRANHDSQKRASQPMNSPAYATPNNPQLKIVLPGNGGGSR